MPTRTALDITQAAGAAADASPEHRRFRSLLTRIDEARERLLAWQRELPEFARQHAAHVRPIEQRVARLRRAYAFELEQLLLSGRFGRAEQDTLARMVCELSGALLASGRGGSGADLADLKALHDRHADTGFDDNDADALETLREQLEAATGLDLGEADSVDELLRKARAAVAEQNEALEQAEAQARGQGPAHGDHAQARRRARGKIGARRSAAERRAEADAAQATQSLREVYRKLAGALHPDRAPAGSSHAERAERTAQMARANAAYTAGDLLALLRLQLELEHVDVAQAGRLAAAQLRHVNRVLAEQLQEIEQEVAEREHTFCATYGFMPERRIDPLKLAPYLKQDAKDLLAAEAAVREQRRALLGEPAAARRLLKGIAKEFRLFDRFDEGRF